MIWGLNGAADARGEVLNGCILIGGDLYATDYSLEDFTSGVTTRVFGADLDMVIRHSRGLIFNLEGPMTDRENPIVKSGPCLRMTQTAMASISQMPILAVGLANNHILDQGYMGLEDTIAALDVAGIPYFGAGLNLAEANSAFIIEVAGKSVGLYACAESEFTIADDIHPGANPIDDLEIKDVIRSLKARSDYVIVLYHGLKEYLRYPSPRVRKRCRAMAEAGADLILCQHSHCVGSAESYLGATILYGQGNFHFVRGHADEFEGNGLMVALDLKDGGVYFLPIMNNGHRVWLASDDEAKTVMGSFLERSSHLDDDKFLDDSYQRFCDSIAESYLRMIRRATLPKPVDFVMRALNRFGIAKSFARDFADRAALLNIIRCEAHNEALATYLKGTLDS